MAQLFSASFFSLIAIGATVFVVAMLWQEWARVAAILRGEELQHAQTVSPRVRVRLRSWSRPELCRPARSLRAAA
jgi:hypothetical protein